MESGIFGHREESHPLQLGRSKEVSQKLSYLMIDLSCLEDICGDTNVLLKPREHTVWAVREGELDVFFVALGNQPRFKKKKKKSFPR